MVEKQLALEAIAKYPWTSLVVSSDGELVDVVPFSAQPGPEAILELGRREASGFRLVPQGKLTEAQLADLVKSLTEAIGYSRTHELRPGVNVPGQAPLTRIDGRGRIKGALRACLDLWIRLTAVFR